MALAAGLIGSRCAWLAAGAWLRRWLIGRRSNVGSTARSRGFHSRWLTVRQAAEYARTSRQAIYTAIHAGALPAHCVGRRLVVDREDLDSWVRSLPAR